MANEEFCAALILSRKKGVGAARFKKLIEQHKLPSIALREEESEECELIGLNKHSLNKSDTQDQIVKTLEGFNRGDFYAYYYGETGYPKQLFCLSEPPPVLYSSAPLKEHKYAAIVGARKMTAKGKELAEIAAKKCIELGYAIVSGGAEGIDSVAHETALNMGAHTMAVFGNGIDVVYPKKNKELFERIAQNGVTVSELMPGTKPAKGFFPTRNRIIAGIAELVIFVQGTEKSGALVTVEWGRRLGKQIKVLPAQDTSPDWGGNVLLLGKNPEFYFDIET
ncbi:MAG: DNA-protecting protein DprA [Candidatus Riflebacteria bacterium]|nr:DNA-protecting protein DprA [Candidatus Riflebacteria bacterium]